MKKRTDIWIIAGEASGDLYGAEAEVYFYSRVREEKKFASLEELRLQIKRDEEAVRKYFE